jgi:hypothetical protein
MNWLAALGVGLCSAPLTGLIVGTAAGLGADWMRMSTREGAAAYFMAALAILGAFVGFLLGIGIARGWFGVGGGFGKSLVFTVGSVLALSLVVTGVVWLVADSNPKIDGKELDLAVELRCPVDTAPVTADRSYVTFIRLSGGSSLGSSQLDVAHAQEIDGRQVVPAKFLLTTSVKRKLLNIYLSPERNLLFALDFDSKPGLEDFEWSRWIDAASPVGEQAPPAGKTFSVRYRVSFVEPPPPTPTHEEQQAAAEAEVEAQMQALAPGAPLESWLVYTRYGVPEARVARAVAAIRARPQLVSEMATLMSSDDAQGSQDAMRSLEHMQPPPTELGPAVAAVGSSIAKSLRELEDDPVADPSYANAALISPRFSAWMVATRALQGKEGIDFVPQLQEIIEPARKHDKSHVLRMDVVRVASYYLQQWGGIEPLPTDPPPR